MPRIVNVVIDYAVAGPLTALDGVASETLRVTATEPVDVCWPVHGLAIQPTDGAELGLAEDRLAESQIRPARGLVERLLALEAKPLSEPRELRNRVVGTCRHFAVLSCALLRQRGIAARVRCGFATYFQPDRAVDHWVVEYRGDAERWARLDPEILGQDVVERPDDLGPGQFLTGGEAWLAFREGRIDASQFDVYGAENWGPAEIRGNAVKDLAALNKVEMLPRDEWGRMTDAYDGKTGADYDDLLDLLADTCGTDDTSAIADLYTHEDLRVPAGLIR